MPNIYKPAVLVDIGGTHLRFGVREPSGVISNVRKCLTPNFVQHMERSAIWDQIVRHITEFTRTTGPTYPQAPIVIAFPGPISPSGIVLDAPTVAGCRGADPELRRRVSEAAQRTVHILNDVSAAAFYFSRSVQVRRFFVVTVSSGIGGKIFDKLYPPGVIDDPGYAGEIGHLMVDEDLWSIPCDCGGQGHVGAIASGRGIERYAKQLARHAHAEFASSLGATRFGGTADNLTNEEHLVPAARLGDPWTWEIIRACTRPLAKVLMATILAAGIEQVIVIGGFALALGDMYLSMLQQEIRRLADYPVVRTQIDKLFLLGDLHPEACLIGAATYLDHLERNIHPLT